MNEAEVTTFFLNLYHVILLHAHVEMGAPSAGSPRFSYLETMAYRVGRATLSLFDIEYHVLRARMSRPDIFGMDIDQCTQFLVVVVVVRLVGGD